MMLTLMNAALCAVNAALYVAWERPWSLAAAIFCGFAALACLAMEMER